MERGNDRTHRALVDPRLGIAFLDASESLDYYVGEISWPGFRESFHASKNHWSKAEYEAQWREGMKRALGGAKKSCLIVSMEDPENANFIRAWAIYRISESEFSMQEQIIFVKNLNKSFDPTAPWDAICDRETMDEDGRQVSEWIIPARYLSEDHKHTG